MTSENRIAVAQEFLEKVLHGEVASAVELLDPGVVYHVPGSQPPSGDFVGPDAVARHVASLMNLTDNTLNVLQWEDWLEGVNLVGAVGRFRVQRPGVIQTFRVIYLMEVSSADKIRRIDLFFSDQEAFSRFFSSVNE